MTVYGDQEALRGRREAFAENSARYASCTITYQTSNSGERVITDPFYFGCIFEVEPTIAYGRNVIQAPDSRHYLYPISNSSVRTWITQRNPTSPTNPFYVGAYLDFNVQINPINFLRTDGSNLSDLEDQLANYTVDSTEWHGVKNSIAEAEEALYLNDHPPTAIINHHITLSQVGIKKLPSSIMDGMYADPVLAAKKVTYGVK